MSQSDIVNFFSDQNIFLTGATGFIGKLLVEKLLRACNVNTLYLLVRPKKNQTIEDRITNYFNFPCFERLKKKNLLKKEKIVFVSGDCREENLGLSKENEDLLLKHVSIVIHAAANVKFDQTLREAGTTNLKCTMDILKLLKKIPQLKSFVYISTTFSNGSRTTVEEKCYPPPMTAEDLMMILKAIPNNSILEEITPTLTKSWPNTYTFSKTLAEHHLYTNGNNLPIAIVRPSIIVQTSEEPMPGWVDNFYGLGGVSAAVALGVLKSFICKADSRMPIVPADFTCNLILAALWDNRAQNGKENETKFYNISSTENNCLTYKQYNELGGPFGARDYALSKGVWCKTIVLTENVLWHKIRTFFLQTLLAYIADTVFLISGKKPMAVEANRRLNYGMGLLTFFTTKEWNFKIFNTLELWNRLSPIDKQLFNFDVETLDYVKYSITYFMGVRLYLMKDPLDTLPQAQKRYKYFTIANYILTYLFYFFVGFIVIYIVKFSFKFM